MNERIRELMLLAGTDTSGKWMGVEHAEQFAQLIVRECADAIAKDSRLGDVRSAANGCVRTIKEHFGVKE
jgi:hypothetical protein